MSAGLGKSIYSRLRVDSAVAAIIGSRIYPQIQPQPAVAPCVVYQVIVDTPTNTLDGSNGGDLYQTRLQVDAYATDYATAQTLADAITAVLGSVTELHFSSVRLSRRDLYEPDTKLHRVSLDFSIWSDL